PYHTRKFSPILDVSPHLSHIIHLNQNLTLQPEIGFPYRELLLPEKHLLLELSNACSVMTNPYQRIRVYQLDEPGASMITDYILHRMILMAKGLSSCREMPPERQEQVVKQNLIKMMMLQSAVI